MKTAPLDPRGPALGVVYTPPPLARIMAQHALAPLLAAARTPADVLALRICDPAAGEGAFLLAARDLLVQRYQHLARLADLRAVSRDPHHAHARAAVSRCLVGVDIDRAALAAPALADCTLHVADALALDWPATFPTTFATGGFDVILANPPYIRQEQLAAHKPALETFAVFDGVADLYVYFIELAHRLLRPRGRYCIVVPNKWMTAAYGRPLRNFLATQNSLTALVDLSATNAFANADAFPCVLAGTLPPTYSDERARSAPPASLFVASVASSPLHAARASSLAELAPLLASTAPAHRVERARWQSDPWHIDAPGERGLLERLERTHPTLGDWIGGRWSRGVVTGCNDAFVIDGATRNALLAAMSSSESAVSATWIRPFVRGRDLRAYALDAPERWLLLVDRGTPLDALPTPLRHHLERFRPRLEPRSRTADGEQLGRKPGNYAWHELQDPVVPLAKARTARMFYQDIQTAPACALDRTGERVPDTTVWILPSADLYLLAVLNSPLYRWYAQRRFPPALNGAVRPKLEYMQRLPIAEPSADLRREIENLVSSLASPPASSPASPLASPLASPVASSLLAQLAQLASLIADAYDLSASERALVGAPRG